MLIFTSKSVFDSVSLRLYLSSIYFCFLINVCDDKEITCSVIRYVQICLSIFVFMNFCFFLYVFFGLTVLILLSICGLCLSRFCSISPIYVLVFIYYFSFKLQLSKFPVQVQVCDLKPQTQYCEFSVNHQICQSTSLSSRVSELRLSIRRIFRVIFSLCPV